MEEHPEERKKYRKTEGPLVERRDGHRFRNRFQDATSLEFGSVAD